MRTIYSNYARSLTAFMLAAMTALLASCGASGVTTTTTATTSTPTAAVLTLSASPTTVPSDNSATTTVTVTALSSTNAAVPGVVVTLAADTGVLSNQTVTTGSSGTATFTFQSGTLSLANRAATITATAGATAQIQIQILGSTLAVAKSTGSSVPNDGSATVGVTFIAKNAQGTALPNTAFTASWVTTTGGQLSISPTSGTTDANGNFTITVAGTGAPSVGTATLSAAAAGSTASALISVTAVAGTFGITQTSNSTGPVVTVNPTTVPMRIGDLLTVTVSAPSSGSVTFNTSQGLWDNGQPSKNVTVVGGTASAVLSQTVAGQANVAVIDPLNTANTDSLVVSITAVTAAKVTLTASPTTVAKNGGTSTLIATVVDANGQPVGNAPVAFSMSNTTGGGESVSPVVAYTASIAGNGVGLGQATTTFTSGTLSSSAQGVQVRATVQNTTVATNTSPSGPDAAIVIGGTAGSIAIGGSTKITADPTDTYYILPMSVLVSDSNGSPVTGATVTLSLWPIAWSTGTVLPCTRDADTATTGTFYNEDWNENLVLDPGEDGTRRYFATQLLTVGSGTLDGLMTPVNSAAGSVPSTVTTDSTGVANFNLTYLKTSAIWTLDRIKASAVVQGTEAVSQHIFPLPALNTDVSPNCLLLPPYHF